MMDYLFIIIGFALLIFGANWLVDGASGIAKRYNVPDLIIGLTIVAFGTSTPELVVNLTAVAKATTTDLALTNIIGSNTINVFIILGIAALIYPVRSQIESRKFDIPMSLLAPLAILIIAWFFGNEITVIGGIILLLIFAFFMYKTVRTAKETKSVSKGKKRKAKKTDKPVKHWLLYVMIVAGLVMLVIGGELIVRNATKIAETWGISQAVIGLTIVALGTSLPELATSAVAAFKKNSDIALGNVIGSNIFNVFFVLGISAVIRPLPGYNGMTVDLLMTALGSLLVLIFVWTNKKYEIKRWEGGLLLILYAVYLVWMINNQ